MTRDSVMQPTLTINDRIYTRRLTNETFPVAFNKEPTSLTSNLDSPRFRFYYNQDNTITNAFNLPTLKSFHLSIAVSTL